MLNYKLTRILALVLFFTCSLKGQDSLRYQIEIVDYQLEQNLEFADSATSPLTAEDIKDFSHLEFFPINPDLKIVAKFILKKGETPFEMATTTDRKPMYIKYGEAHFTLDGKDHVLTLYRSLRLAQMEAYQEYLFLPFKDFTNGIESYGGGRFLDLEVPEGDTIVIDFNKAYNPYCAYNSRYSCPIPPVENSLQIEIRAGVKKYADH